MLQLDFLDLDLELLLSDLIHFLQLLVLILHGTLASLEHAPEALLLSLCLRFSLSLLGLQSLHSL